MENINRGHSAIVLGLSICGLGVIRSLGREKIKVFGFDYAKENRDGFYSKYVKADICPHPAYHPQHLVDLLINKFSHKNKRPVLFPTSDEFVKFISDYRNELEKYFLFNVSSKEIIDGIIDKKVQYESAKKAAVAIADTYYPESVEEVFSIREQLKYPLIIKGRYSFKWREALGGTFKGFKVNNSEELTKRCSEIFKKKIPIIIQKVIIGPNTNHYKFCAYVEKTGNILAKFTLRKIRQYPVEFGVGSCIESLEYPELEQTGAHFFNKIGYRGIGSAEFKLDLADNRLKLIELNPRYWMQNEHATLCGINFALIQYLDLTGQTIDIPKTFKRGVGWVDPVQDLKSFLRQSPKGKFLLFHWLKFVLNCKMFSVFSWQDLKPFIVSLNYGLKLLKFPFFLLKETKKNRNG
jgi:predicted ATP-grasp superfamily ATP-dependent carboligase